MNNQIKSFSIIIGTTLVGSFFGLKYCGPKLASQVVEKTIANTISAKIRYGISPNVTLTPTSYSQEQNEQKDGNNLRSTVEGLMDEKYPSLNKPESSHSGSGTPTIYAGILVDQTRNPISFGDWCDRRHCTWDSSSGKFSYSRYNFSFAPGIEIFAPEGLGIDARFFRVGDFGAQIGAAYFQATKEVSPSAGLSYNLRIISYLSNCDLFVSYTPKSWIGGIRVELGD